MIRLKTLLLIKRIILAMALSISMLTILCLAYKYTGIHIVSEYQQTYYSWEKDQYIGNMKEGFAWIIMDTNGFNNSYPRKKKNPDYLLMGSSHMEAIQINSTENTGYILNDMIKDDYFYNIGISGSNIYKNVNNLDFVSRKFSPQKGIIIETFDVNLDYESMDNVLKKGLSNPKTYPKGIKYYIMRYFYSIRFLYEQVLNWGKMDAKLFIPISGYSINNDDAINEKYNDKLNEFLLFAKSSINKEQKLLIVFKPFTKIDENGKYISTKKDPSTELFKEACLRNGIEFIDLSDAFENLYNSKHILAHGFINSAVGVGHLNKYGHRVFAEEVAKVIGGNN